MHEPMNGHPGWRPPSPWDMLLNSLNRIERHQVEQSSRLGGLETGQRLTLDAVEKSFDLHRETDLRVSRIESAVRRPPDTPPPTEPAGLLTSLTALSAAVKDMLPLVALAIYLLAALGAAVSPDVARAILNIEK
jgi:hypothetical protein